jgi:hypothetical protein
LGLTSYRGITGLDGNSTIIVMAHNGDASLDGKVDALDLNILAAHWQQQTGALWSAGDFTGDGKVDALDLNVLAANWQFGTAVLASVPVPEPASLLLFSAPLLYIATRRRHR